MTLGEDGKPSKEGVEKIAESASEMAKQAMIRIN
jgi:hypothetical protein